MRFGRTGFFVTIFIAVVCCTPFAAWAEGWDVNIGLGLGSRSFNSLNGSKTAFDVRADFGQDWPANILVGFSSSTIDSGTCRTTAGNTVSCDVNLTEVYIGAIKYFTLVESKLRPFVTAGFASENLSASSTSASGTIDMGSTTGFFFEGGGLYRFSDKWSVGLDVRFLTGSSGVGSTNKNADYTHVGALISYAW